MPIRINLLAEDFAQDEARRKDPVKLAYLAGVLAVGAALVWSSSMQMQILLARSDHSRGKKDLETIKKAYEETVLSQKSATDAETKLLMLQQLTTNRFLWGNTLNALQQWIKPADEVQIMRLKCDQLFVIAEGTKPKTNNGVLIRGKPGTATEKVSLLIEAIDIGAQPGVNVNKFKQSLSSIPYFRDSVRKTNGVMLLSLSPPTAIGNGGGQYASFSIQCNFPEKVR